MAAPPVTEEVQAQNSPQVTVYTIDYGTSLLPDPKNNLFGLDIFLDARVSGSGYANFNWEQTVTTNYPLDDKPANQPYPDPGPDPFYYSNTPDKVPLLSAQGFAERVAQPARGFYHL
ncbi:MAG TPA: hypothetical protein VFR24_09775 [Candidatus Angelobacter sp.]|nr:hypothetical protein [Candidatus Angelobacter sp.]